MLSFGQMAQAVLCNNNRAVYDEPEIKCAEAHQVGADPRLQHTRGGNEHRDWYDHCGDERRTEIAQQQEENKNDQKRTDRQIPCHRIDCGIHELGPIEHRSRTDTWRQSLIDFNDLCVGGCRYGATIAADQHQRRAEHHLVSVDARAACPQLAANRYGGNIFYPNWNGAAGTNYDVLDFGEAFDPPASTHHISFPVAFDIISATAKIVGLDGPKNVIERKLISDQARRIGLDLVLLHIAADCVSTGDSCYSLHLRPDDPVLHRTQIDRPLKFVC